LHPLNRWLHDYHSVNRDCDFSQSNESFSWHLSGGSSPCRGVRSLLAKRSNRRGLLRLAGCRKHIGLIQADI